MTNGLPNLDAVDAKANIWRSGQPTHEGFAWIKSQGVTNIVKLNAEESDWYAVKLGLNITYFPIDPTDQILGEPWKARWAAAAIRPNTLVHCSHGQDRTGLVVAIYRVKHDGWTKAAAEKEMLAHGFHKMLFGLWNYWREFNPAGKSQIIPAGTKD